MILYFIYLSSLLINQAYTAAYILEELHHQYQVFRTCLRGHHPRQLIWIVKELLSIGYGFFRSFCIWVGPLRDFDYICIVAALMEILIVLPNGAKVGETVFPRFLAQRCLTDKTKIRRDHI